MCGRFENFTRDGWQMDKDFPFDEDHFINKIRENRRINIAPSSKIVGIFINDNCTSTELANWGIKFGDKYPNIINSRIETIVTKQSWNTRFDKKRCVIPMTAFYEWEGPKGSKIPYRIFLKSEELFFVPGLYHTDNEKNKHVSLITTEPNDFMKRIYKRMPVILEPHEAQEYLFDEAENNIERCLPYKYSDNMKFEQVSLN